MSVALDSEVLHAVTTILAPVIMEFSTMSIGLLFSLAAIVRAALAPEKRKNECSLDDLERGMLNGP